MEPGRDLRELFIQEILDHLEAIGRKGHHVCFIEPKYSGTGIDEQAPLAEYYLHRHGLNIMLADPAELYLRDGEVWYGDSPVDIAYRDYEVRDLIELERDGESFVDVDRDFHLSLYQTLGNPLVENLIELFWELFVRLGDAIPGHPENNRGEAHLRIVQALQTGDADASIARMREHFDDVRERAALLGEESDPAADGVA